MELGKDISARYAGARELRLIAVMRGARPFFLDLRDAIDHPNFTEDTIRIKSYRGTESNRKPRVVTALHKPVLDLAVVTVEDIVDTGHSLVLLDRIVRAGDPASHEVVSLLEKPDRREPGTEIPSRLTTGFRIASEFVIGYGLDLDERYRDLPFIQTCKQIRPGAWVPRYLEEPDPLQLKPPSALPGA